MIKSCDTYLLSRRVQRCAANRARVGLAFLGGSDEERGGDEVMKSKAGGHQGVRGSSGNDQEGVYGGRGATSAVGLDTDTNSIKMLPPILYGRHHCRVPCPGVQRIKRRSRRSRLLTRLARRTGSLVIEK
eukprot:73400-Prorocentrum_minimum.AAC.1